jgi:hypothetical protein
MKGLAALAAALLALAVQAVVLQPARDDEVIERLPPAPPRAAAPSSPQDAAQRALALVAQARRAGDPRLAGQALALLRPWADDPRAAAPVVIALVDAEQHLHRFDAARTRLLALAAREAPPPQAWLMLATLQRLQGHYAAADAACAGLRRSGAELYALACTAENAALRGAFDAARARLQVLLRAAPDAATQSWLYTTLAELEQRAGRPAPAEAAFRAALQAQPDGYSTLALADLLLDQSRAAEALALLRDQPDSDAVLLRRARADPRTDNEAAAELRRRFAQADLRPGAAEGHGRERALFALFVEHDAAAALRHARANVRVQREPADLLLLLRAAHAAGDAAARQEAHQLVEEMGLEDRRLQAWY